MTNLFIVTQFISDHLDRASQVDVIYTDWSKAFDRLNHQILLGKLIRFGFSRSLVSLFGSLLSGRQQFVENRGVRSPCSPVCSGVPQGSIFGPLLFNIFINDLTDKLSVRHLLYADDLKLFCSVTSPADCMLLQRNLDNILYDWTNENDLPLNVSKCNILSFYRIKQPILHSYTVDGTALSRVDRFSDLGVIFDTQLSFVPHIETLVSGCCKSMGFIIRNGGYFSPKVLLKLFNTFVRSRMEYASVIWSPCYEVHVGQLETVLRKFLKYLSFRCDGIYPEIGYPQEALLERFETSSLRQRRMYHSVVFLYKVVNYLIHCLSISQQLVFNTPRSGARNQTVFYLPLAHTRAQQWSPLYTMCRNYACVQHKVDLFSDQLSRIKSVFFGRM